MSSKLVLQKLEEIDLLIITEDSIKYKLRIIPIQSQNKTNSNFNGLNVMRSMFINCLLTEILESKKENTKVIDLRPEYLQDLEANNSFFHWSSYHNSYVDMDQNDQLFCCLASCFAGLLNACNLFFGKDTITITNFCSTYETVPRGINIDGFIKYINDNVYDSNSDCC